ncbi:helix-turn-helix domain-containing protein [Nocardiopsis salina]|uniref:helix-turn-helix domain-containing protein n=1 Tax=Nocardiopsis salina TaxID=245836 RepID=UPI00034A3852|nr:helix-turn-helix transcriptional regulator [Nocardiopsis salina]
MPENDFTSLLCKLRELSGLSQGELADRVESSSASVSRWENGVVTPKRAKVEELDQVLHGRGRLARAWEPVATGLQMPPWMRSAGALEDKAVSIASVTVSNLVPGMVQSIEYARYVFRTGHPTASADEVERLAQLRVARYESLTGRNDPFVTVVFPLSALKGLPGHVRVDQLEALLRHIGRGRLAAHLIPDHTPIFPVSTPIQVYRLMDGRKVAASDHALGNHVYESTEEADKIERIVTHVIGRCFPVDDTVRLLEELL